MDFEFELIVGSMFAGKSKYLIDNYYNNKNVAFYKSNIDTRDIGVIKSRDYTKTIPCTQISSVKEINTDKSIIVIDEYQFFKAQKAQELKDFVNKCKKEHKKIVMAGLDLLANGKEWLSYTEMKNLATKQIKLKARCSVCKQPASFTKLVNGDENKEIQVHALYEPRCQKHF